MSLPFTQYKLHINLVALINKRKMADTLHHQHGRTWLACLPPGAEYINDISNEAVWTLSSCKGLPVCSTMVLA
jgi:hypothetical protein